jgi:hypothetical protein
MYSISLNRPLKQAIYVPYPWFWTSKNPAQKHPEKKKRVFCKQGMAKNQAMRVFSFEIWF